MNVFEQCAEQAKESMLAGNEPTCTMDAWIKQMIDGSQNSGGNGRKGICFFSSEEIAMTAFTFLFASQDASSSATA